MKFEIEIEIFNLTKKKHFLNLNCDSKTEVNPDTQEPLPRLTGATRQWCQEAGLAFVETVGDVTDAVRRGRACDTTTATNERDLDCAKFVQAIDSAIKRANAKAISNAQRVQKWDILPNDFSVPGGELGKSCQVFKPINQLASDSTWIRLG